MSVGDVVACAARGGVRMRAAGTLGAATSERGKINKDNKTKKKKKTPHTSNKKTHCAERLHEYEGGGGDSAVYL